MYRQSKLKQTSKNIVAYVIQKAIESLSLQFNRPCSFYSFNPHCSSRRPSLLLLKTNMQKPSKYICIHIQPFMPYRPQDSFAPTRTNCGALHIRFMLLHSFSASSVAVRIFYIMARCTVNIAEALYLIKTIRVF